MSASHTAFLRAVNLGRNRRVSGARLCSLFEELGFEDVASFRTSGNVVFRAGRAPADELLERVEAHLSEALGHEAQVFLRSRQEMRRLAKAQPFESAAVERSQGKLQVLLLRGKPSKRAREAVLALATDDDRLAFGASELYWLPAGGTRDSALDRGSIDELLGSTTMRTKGTIEQLAAKHFAS